MAYLLDANVFIAANNLHYGLDFCPAFWDWLVAGHESERVFSVEKVGDEVQALGDELSEWAEARGNGFFLPPDASVFPALAEVSAWATGQAYEPAAVNTFLQVADYYLVAQALAGRHTVVTHEVPSASSRKIKIPDACIGLGKSHCISVSSTLARVIAYRRHVVDEIALLDRVVISRNLVKYAHVSRTSGGPPRCGVYLVVPRLHAEGVIPPANAGELTDGG